MSLEQLQERRQINHDFINEIITKHKLDQKLNSPTNTNSLVSSDMTDQVIKMFNQPQKKPILFSPNDQDKQFISDVQSPEQDVISEIDNIIDQIKQKYKFKIPQQEAQVVRNEDLDNYDQQDEQDQYDNYKNLSATKQFKNSMSKKISKIQEEQFHEDQNYIKIDQSIEINTNLKGDVNQIKTNTSDFTNNIKNQIKNIQQIYKPSQKKENLQVIQLASSSGKKTSHHKSNNETPNENHFIQEADFTFQTPLRALNYEGESNLSYSQSQMSFKNFSPSKSVDQMINEDKILQDLDYEETQLMRELQDLKKELQEIDE